MRIFPTSLPDSKAPLINSSHRRSELPFFLGLPDNINTFLLMFLTSSILLAFFHHVDKPFYHSRVIVGKECACFRVQCCYTRHILFGEGEVKYIQIFLHPLDMGGFRDYHHAPLQMPAENDLRRTLAVLGTDFV